MKRKIPFTKLLIVSSRRYRAAKSHSYHVGYREGLRVATAAAPEAALPGDQSRH
jgi:hypothetical protein